MAKWSFTPSRDAAECIEETAAARGISRAAAVNELVTAGWRAEHGHLLANGIMRNVRDVMLAVAAEDARERSAELDSLAERLDDAVLRLEAASIAALIATGTDPEGLDEAYGEALAIAAGRP